MQTHDFKHICIALGLILTGCYPLYILLSTLNSPDYQDTVGAWLAMVAMLAAGTWIAGENVKAKGHQKDSTRIFGIVTFFIGIILFFIPVVASLLLASGRGT